LNPIEWLKLAYETFGANHPKASMIGVTILGGIVFAGVWHFAAVQYHKDQMKQPTVATPTVTNTTSGPESPINTGNGNNFNYKEPPLEKKSAVQPKKGDGP
jgi:hypothetical protein